MIKRSALYHLQARCGAAFIEHHGWQIPASFLSPESEAAAVRNGVGLADVSYRPKFESKNFNENAHRGSGCWRLNSHRYLTTGEASLDPVAGGADVTSVYADLLLAGPRSRNVLSKLTSLKVSEDALGNLSVKQASLAHTHAIVLREDVAELPAFHILVSREYSESVWEAIIHAGHEFHLEPFGLKALELLRS